MRRRQAGAARIASPSEKKAATPWPPPDLATRTSLTDRERYSRNRSVKFEDLAVVPARLDARVHLTEVHRRLAGLRRRHAVLLERHALADFRVAAVRHAARRRHHNHHRHRPIHVTHELAPFPSTSCRSFSACERTLPPEPSPVSSGDNF